MIRSHLLLSSALLAGTIMFAQSAAAQIPSSYTPQSPAVSPWMGLWQQNTGALDNYHTFVQPQMQLNAALQAQNAALSRQGASLQALNNEIMQPQGRQSGMVATGQGAGFMNYSHYYAANRQPTRAATLRPNAARSTANVTSGSGYSQ
jgi:hypothetical protein